MKGIFSVICLSPYLISSIYLISDWRSIGDINNMPTLPEMVISDKASRVGRPKINDEQTPARLIAGTLARIDALLAEGEKRADFIREAIEREIKRRSRQKD
jgi:hypothetical protein